MYNITFDLPNLGAGAVVQVNGLGVFENGKTYHITEEQATAFRVYHQVVEDVTTHVTDEGTGEEIEVVQTQITPGQTLLQAFEGTNGVTVETAGKEQKETAKQRKAREEAEQKLRESISGGQPNDQQEQTEEGGNS